MKRVIALLLCAVFSFTLLFVCSCDYQDKVDSARSNLMETAKDLLDPFLNQSKPTENSTVDTQPGEGTSDVK